MNDEQRSGAEDAAMALNQQIWQAEQLLQRKRLDAARQLLGEALQAHPHDNRIHLSLARADYLDDQYTDAREHLSQVLAADPDSESARALLHNVASEQGQLAEAETLILGLLREHPDDAGYYAMYARLMLKALDFAKAGQLADEALRMAPDDAFVLRARALCDVVEQRRGSDATAMMKLIVADPNDEHTLRLVLASLVERRRFREARDLARELLRAHPQDRWCLNVAKQMHYLTHWTLLPLWPLQRFGWAGSAAVWLFGVGGIRVINAYAPALSSYFVALILGYVAYSWIWPRVLRRLLGIKA